MLAHRIGDIDGDCGPFALEEAAVAAALNTTVDGNTGTAVSDEREGVRQDKKGNWERGR